MFDIGIQTENTIIKKEVINNNGICDKHIGILDNCSQSYYDNLNNKYIVDTVSKDDSVERIRRTAFGANPFI